MLVVLLCVQVKGRRVEQAEVEEGGTTEEEDHSSMTGKGLTVVGEVTQEEDVYDINANIIIMLSSPSQIYIMCSKMFVTYDVDDLYHNLIKTFMVG